MLRSESRSCFFCLPWLCWQFDQAPTYPTGGRVESDRGGNSNSRYGGSNRVIVVHRARLPSFRLLLSQPRYSRLHEIFSSITGLGSALRLTTHVSRDFLNGARSISLLSQPTLISSHLSAATRLSNALSRTTRSTEPR